MEEKFGIVIAVGLAIFGIAFVLDSTGGNISAPPGDQARMVFAEKSYGKLGESNPDDRVIDFGDFTVGEARGEILAYRNQEVKVSDAFLAGDSLVFRYNATQPRGGEITFEVLGRKGRGEVYVKVNGRKIFSRSLVSTGTPKIDVPRQYLNPGINRFRIGVSKNSIFGYTEYALEEVQLRVNDRKFHDYRDTFRLYSYELQDYLKSPLSFQVASSVKTSPLRVYINEKQVYSRPQVRARETVRVTPGNADLHPGANTIRFETDSPAKYRIENAELTVRYLGNVERRNVVFSFEMTGPELNYAGRDRTDEYISFDYQNLLPSPRPVRIELNSFNRTFSPENGRNRVELPEGVLKEENSFSFRTNGTYQLNSLEILSEKGEN